MLRIKKLLADFIKGKPLNRPQELLDLAEEVVSSGPSEETIEEWAARLSKDLAEFND